MSFDTDFDANFDSPARSPVEQLIEALRSPLPEGFKWDFRSLPRCAAGLAYRLRLDIWKGVGASPYGFDHPFGATERDGVIPLYGVPARDVTPAMVADALERLVGREGAPPALHPMENR
jgi:hypothetical protein